MLSLLCSVEGFVSRTTSIRYSKTRLSVLTTPESIIEQASTQSLLDDLIDESVRTSARRPIMLQFDPSSGWIWKRWKGTIFSETWDSCVSKMMYACIVFFVCKTFPGIKDSLSGFNILWGQLLSVTTFTLTFFVNQSYALWRKCYELSRRLQGRLHDIDLALAVHAARKAPSSPSEPSTYTAGSRQILELVSRYVRLFNVLTYASFTRSHRPILTPRGMRRLVERGLMTSQERQVLVDAEIPATQRHNAVLLWIFRTYIEGREAGHFLGGAGFENQLMEKVHVTRGQYGAIGDELQGRMPLAYAHIVQVLVDLILWMYPFMAFASGMSGLLTVLGTGLLTVSYQGLFDLAKQFLDPYDNESYGRGEDPLVVDTLIAETNAGSVRWMYGLEEYPVNPQRIKDGELSDYLLPLRGYSVEELQQMEEEKLQKEKEVKEKRKREEEERRKIEEQERLVREAAEAMIPAQINVTSALNLPTDVSYHLAVNGGVVVGPGVPLGSMGQSTPTTAASVTRLVDMMAVLGDDLVESLIPEGTAPAEPLTECLEDASEDETMEEESIEEEPEDIQFGGDMDEYLPGFQEIDVNGDDETSYVHTFDAFDPYKDLPWYEETGPDGKEIRLSQLMADEVWDEELEAALDKEPVIRTYEEFVERATQIQNATANELLETQEILMEKPGTQSVRQSRAKATERSTPMYDQTKLDGISQLWGLPPDELSEIAGYNEPPVIPEDDDFGSIGQLWGGPGPSPTKVSSGDRLNDVFGQISQLWGEDITAEVFPAPMATAGTRRIKDDTDALGKSYPVEPKEVRMSQMLANEIWAEPFEAKPVEPVTFEDYSKQVQDILELEKKEMLETAAILNAPPAADSVEVPEKERKGAPLQNVNATDTEDDLAALEMDTPLKGVVQVPAKSASVDEGIADAAALGFMSLPNDEVATDAEDPLDELDLNGGG